MTSEAASKRQFLHPRILPEDPMIDEKLPRFRHPTVYDAVAGRISVAGFIPKHKVVASTRDTVSSSASAISPEAVLFRSRNAPTRYAESDIYFANERQSVTDLPESDILKALHCYTSDFYSRAAGDGGSGDWKSLDETALIALGIIMEEASLSSLGETGDLTFTEGEEVIDLPQVNDGEQRATSKERPSKKRRVEAAS
ncbi:uncharacterized protein L3040_001286 [Drepanopeziza brunnea f. sp. 'multigermtubi']|uniref:Uncharacterized protein n=1 Tax=Marssonina brunnea f. sp. multigermtubi (strain MB_m1) TaxID=1072389 RepID=K1WU16_MARBU|nr:uncharacterized protein MBM_05015 [Drepanopeziza brunnea f. sp. 'multigermtubi' MB_m1]EKD16546.1 hypothetical protein MBM_05015 [Drepanopeziza brunnea f. sp. 'multigermtubi' MB_m1]KAJ5051510.1 hypothetical protein L3040_001286 [Drepanopeziza brunnea f. sp. 'multigermtubi']